ncbi:MAG: right-handed parallel beta-helix repeat-containing protein [Planctomycetota bacterium]|jgi:beta propeller repeat protein
MNGGLTLTKFKKAFILIIISISASVSAGTLIVGPGESIQNAIDTAGIDDIIVVEPGRYYENIDFHGKAVVLRSLNPDDPNIVAQTIIDANGQGSAVTFISGEGSGSVLTGFTITGGTGTPNPDLVGEDIIWGAGIYCINSSPTIRSNTITGNHISMDNGYGGGVLSFNSNALITQNIIRNNTAFAGAGICVFIGEGLISDNYINNNEAVIGAGVVMLFSTSRLTDSIINNNSAQLCGGVYPTTSAVENCTISYNSALEGGAICYSEAAIKNCIIANNRSNNFGSALFQCDGPVTNCTITQNDAGMGAAIYEYYGQIKNCILWNNQPSNFYDSSQPQYSCIQGGYLGIGNISEDPMFLDPDANDFHLHMDSPCINTGDPDYIPAIDETDIDYQPRILSGRVDIGADEFYGYFRPRADAGEDQYMKTIQTVTLDGSESWFYNPGGTKEYNWTQTAGPKAKLSDPHSVNPTFNPKEEADYRFELVVRDSNLSSLPDEVLIVVGNRLPIADAGSDKTGMIGQQVTLDGKNSYDPDPADNITFQWSQLIVSDGFEDSIPSTVQVMTIELTINQADLNFSIGSYNHYGDVSGTKVIFANGEACDYTWNSTCIDLKTGEESSFHGVGGTSIDTQTKIDGDIVVWCGGIGFGGPWFHEPSNTSIFIRNLDTEVQKTLRQYTWSESYSHPSVSREIVVWLEHLNLDTLPPGNDANNWWDTPYNICGADITDLENLRYFTIAENVGNRDPYPCHSYAEDFDDVIDIYDNIVVYEGNGDIYGADISDLNDIRIFPICKEPSTQYDPAIWNNIVVWTDQRNDSGDIYGADISDTNNIRVFELIARQGTQQQAEIDEHTIVYVNVTDGYAGGQINVASMKKDCSVFDIPLDPPIGYGMGPAIDGSYIVWQDNYYGKAHGILLEASYSLPEGPVQNLTTQKKYEYIQHAINQAGSGDVVVAEPETYYENIDFKGKNLTLKSSEPGKPSVVAATIIKAGNKPVVTFSNDEHRSSRLMGFSITGGKTGILCSGEGWKDTSPTISNCIISKNRRFGIEMFFIKFPVQGGPKFENCIIEANGSDGIYSDLSISQVNNCTIARNGGYGISGLDRLLPRLSNSIVYFNNGEAVNRSPGHGLIATYCDIEGGYPGLGNFDQDPCFADVANGDYHLLENSSCIDAGKPDFIPEPNEVDIDGQPRIFGDYVDVGADEFIPMIEASMMLTPRILNAGSNAKWVKAHIVLPAEYDINDVDANEPLILEPLGINSEYMTVFVNSDGFAAIEAAFKRSGFAIAADYGTTLITATGRLHNGYQFYGTDTIQVFDRRLQKLADISSAWLEICQNPNLCLDADLNGDGIVNFLDLAMIDERFIEIIAE